MKKAFVSEIYPSVQGEGPYTGERQLFVRLAGCPLRCDYCDTPDSLVAQGHDQMTVEEVMSAVAQATKSFSLSTVSVTGGEPLVYAGFLKELFPLFKTAGLKIYLETAGVHPEALSEVVDYCDVVSMDMKLPSAVGRAYWSEHEEFLKVGGNKIFVKIVMEKHSKEDEMDKALEVLSKGKTPPLLVLQPVTPDGKTVAAPDADQISSFYKKAKQKLPNVLVMPQQHKLWGVR